MCHVDFCMWKNALIIKCTIGKCYVFLLCKNLFQRVLSQASSADFVPCLSILSHRTHDDTFVYGDFLIIFKVFICCGYAAAFFVNGTYFLYHGMYFLYHGTTLCWSWSNHGILTERGTLLCELKSSAWLYGCKTTVPYYGWAVYKNGNIVRKK